MYGKKRTNCRLSIDKRIIAAMVMMILLCANVHVPVSSSYTATIGTDVPRVVFYYDDTMFDVQYNTVINGSYATISNNFTLDSSITSLYFKVSGTQPFDVLCDGIVITDDVNNVYSISNINSNTAIIIGTVVNLDVSYGSIVIGGNDANGDRKYTYTDSEGTKTGIHVASNIYMITGTTGTVTEGNGNNITLTGAGDFNVVLNDVNIYSGRPGGGSDSGGPVGLGLCAPVSTDNVTGNGNINITLVGNNTLANVSSNPANSFAALEKSNTNSTLIVNGKGELNAIGGADSAGIGSSNNASSGGTKNITINNGTITATTTASEGAGIGSGDNKEAENIRIYGGTITATGYRNGSGIGGSGSRNYVASLGQVYIYGGTINARSNGHGAGIGGGGSGEYNESVGGNGEVHIYGGNITTDSIGGGSGGSGGGSATVEIFGGRITTTGSIGGGDSQNAYGGMADITISGGTISAANISGGHGFGGSHSGGTLSISGGSSNVDHVCNEITTTGFGGVVLSCNVVECSVVNALVTEITFSNDLNYALNDTYTDEEGKLYLWLPSGFTVYSVIAEGTEYSINVQKIANITSSATPVIVGTVLTAILSGETESSYQWQRYTGSTWTDIEGSTSKTYSVRSDDAGSQILVIINGVYSLPVLIPAPPTFAVTIPESVTASTVNGSFSIKGDRYHFEHTQSLTVSCSGDFEMELTGATNTTLSYRLYGSSTMTQEIVSGSDIATFVGSGSTTKELYYNVIDLPVYAGTYTDTLTFTFTLNNGS